jgi:EmrB/QacA subfamily drug resistance transporter
VTSASATTDPDARADDAGPDAGLDYRFSHAEILRVLSGVLLCIFLAAIDQTVVIPAVPAMAADLNGFGHLSWIVSAYLLTATAATPIYGKLSDIYGRRALLLPALALFAAASALCALSQTLAELIAARAVQGIGGAGLMSMAQAAIADVVSPRERGRYQGYMAGAWGVASIAGPILGGWVVDSLSWRWIFWINLPVALLAMLLCDRALRLLVVRRRERARIDYAGAALLTGAVTCFLLVLSQGGSELAWTSPSIVALVAAGLAMLTLLVLQERRAGDPLLPPRLFADAVIVSGITLAFLGSLALFGGLFLLPLFFQLVEGVDASHSGALVMPFLALNVVGAFTAGRLARRIGKVRGILLAGLATSLAGFAAMAALGAGAATWATVAAQCVMGLGLGLTMPICLVTVQNAAQRRDVGAVTGCVLFLRSMGGAFGSTLVGAILASRFAESAAASGVAGRLDLGQARSGGAAFAALPQAAQAALHAGLGVAFQLAFAACGLALALALLVAARMRDLPLRTGAEPVASQALAD